MRQKRKLQQKRTKSRAWLEAECLKIARRTLGGSAERRPEGVLFATLDRADNEQYREFYTSQAAIEAAKRGEPLPNGTVIINVQYAAQLDAQGNPVKDANGRFIKTNIVAYNVMEKRAGWGTEYPDDIHNGEWEYQALRPATNNSYASV
jgi:Cytochrome P460